MAALSDRVAGSRLERSFLVLIPTATIKPNWVEQTLKVAEWDIWLELAERVNPAAVQASRDFDARVGPAALQDGSIKAQSLRLESRLESRITEVSESDDKVDDDVPSDSNSNDSSGDRANDSIPVKAVWGVRLDAENNGS
ncbi:hypothetical protein EK21DRAFT_118978 [Setomelanomma holmii]|uniref:Uncharacterized protein n=1 Tax=Setomelanomma holmii TaxID=210430 RepID=A0A9P4GV08_9PLEO|nr:hypothetical protein EK21DRAFT_118978 [Setomelanomma holmii]